MDSQTKDNPLAGKLADRIAIVPLLFAVVLGNSLIRFNEILFPPKLLSVNFWAFSVFYLAAFVTWFGWSQMTRELPKSITEE